jgi:hypothetical protein
MTGWKQWAIAEVVDADEFQTYLQDQVVQVYADEDARTLALGSNAAEGMICYLKNIDALFFYNGSAWVAAASDGDITAVTAGTALTGGGSSGAVTLNVNLAAVTIPLSQINDGLATGVAAFLGTPTSNNLRTVVTDETGTGALVFATSPTFAGTVTGNPANATTASAAAGFGYTGIPQNATTTGAYTLVAADAGRHVYGSATRTVTIPANSAVALPLGTTVVFVAGTGATMTIAITTDTLLLAGPGTTGSRTLAPFGIATAVKITATSWLISGNGLT